MISEIFTRQNQICEQFNLSVGQFAAAFKIYEKGQQTSIGPGTVIKPKFSLKDLGKLMDLDPLQDRGLVSKYRDKFIHLGLIKLIQPKEGEDKRFIFHEIQEDGDLSLCLGGMIGELSESWVWYATDQDDEDLDERIQDSIQSKLSTDRF